MNVTREHAELAQLWENPLRFLVLTANPSFIGSKCHVMAAALKSLNEFLIEGAPYTLVPLTAGTLAWSDALFMLNPHSPGMNGSVWARMRMGRFQNVTLSK